MSSYLNFVVEGEEASLNWRDIYHTSYDDEKDVINQYLLKGVFWDTDHFSGSASALENLSDKSKCMFGEKIQEVNPNRGGPFAHFEKATYDKPTYPYKYSQAFTTEGMCRDFHGKDLKVYILNYLEKKGESALTKFNKTWLEINVEAIKKHFELFSSYLTLNIDANIEEYEKARAALVKNPERILDCFDPENEIHFTNILTTTDQNGKTIYCWVMDTPYDWYETIKYHPSFKDENILEEVFGDHFGQIIYIDTIEKPNAVIPQFEIRNAKVSYKKDIEDMLHELKNELAEAEHSRNADVSAKAKAKEFLDEYTKDSETELYKALSEWVGEVEDVATLEYIDELKNQLAELEKLNALMNDKNRLIWSIE